MNAPLPPAAETERLPDLALTLFDRTQTLHELGDDCRRLLAEAGALAGAALPAARKKPFKRIQAFVRQRLDGALPDGDLATLAAALAVFQRRLRRRDLADEALDAAQRQRALTLAALLRIAEALAAHDVAIQKLRLEPDELWIVLEGPGASAACKPTQRAAVLWDRLGYSPATVLEAEEAAIRLAPFPEPTETIGLIADDPLSEAARKVMRFQFARTLAVEQAARLGDDIDGVHDMRVGTRRLRAAFEVFEDAFAPGALKPYRDGLRKTGRALGKVRDLDVLLLDLKKYAAELPEERRPGLAPLRKAWQAQREAARAELLAFLDGKEYADFKRHFNIFLLTPFAGARKATGEAPVPTRVREWAPLLIYRRLAAVRAYGPGLEHAPVAQLHMLRIEFKKLRYTVEYFQEALGRRSREVIDTLKLLQDHLGEMNDCEVACGLIEAFIQERESDRSGEAAGDRAGLDEVAQYLAYRCQMREQLIRSFPEAWKKLFLRPPFRRAVAQSVSVL